MKTKTRKGRSQTRVITKEIEIEAPIEAVWKALTDAEELCNWFPLQAGEKPDGTFWMAWDDQFMFESRTTHREEGKRIRGVTIPPEGAPPGPENATETTLETRDGKTVVRIVHSGFSTDSMWDEMFDGTDRGWDFELRGHREARRGQRPCYRPYRPESRRHVASIPARRLQRRRIHLRRVRCARHARPQFHRRSENSLPRRVRRQR